MSQIEHHFGRVKELYPKKGESIYELMIQLIEQENNEKIPSKQMTNNDIIRWFNEYCCNTHIFHKERVFLIKNTKTEEYEDISRAVELADGSIYYELRYYNGATYFTEMLKEALDNVI